jgi:hypothetical protein
MPDGYLGFQLPKIIKLNFLPQITDEFSLKKSRDTVGELQSMIFQ